MEPFRIDLSAVVNKDDILAQVRNAVALAAKEAAKEDIEVGVKINEDVVPKIIDQIRKLKEEEPDKFELLFDTEDAKTGIDSLLKKLGELDKQAQKPRKGFEKIAKEFNKMLQQDEYVGDSPNSVRYESDLVKKVEKLHRIGGTFSSLGKDVASDVEEAYKEIIDAWNSQSEKSEDVTYRNRLQEAIPKIPNLSDFKILPDKLETDIAKTKSDIFNSFLKNFGLDLSSVLEGTGSSDAEKQLKSLSKNLESVENELSQAKQKTDEYKTSLENANAEIEKLSQDLENEKTSKKKMTDDLNPVSGNPGGEKTTAELQELKKLIDDISSSSQNAFESLEKFVHVTDEANSLDGLTNLKSKLEEIKNIVDRTSYNTETLGLNNLLPEVEKLKEVLNIVSQKIDVLKSIGNLSDESKSGGGSAPKKKTSSGSGKSKDNSASKIDKITDKLASGEYHKKIASLQTDMTKWGLSAEEVTHRLSVLNDVYEDLLTHPENEGILSKEKEFLSSVNEARESFNLEKANSVTTEKMDSLIKKLQNFRTEYEDLIGTDSLAELDSKIAGLSGTRSKDTYNSTNNWFSDFSKTQKSIIQTEKAISNAEQRLEAVKGRANSSWDAPIENLGKDIEKLNEQLRSGEISTNKYKESIKELFSSMTQRRVSGGSFIQDDVNSLQEANEIAERTASSYGEVRKKGNFTDDVKSMTYEIVTLDGEIKTLQFTYDGAMISMADRTKTVKKELGTMETVFDSLKSKIGQLALYWTAQYFNPYKIFDVARRGFDEVVDLDTALVDLKKTTAMNDDELNQFYFDANKVAKQMGVTTEEIINQASAWSRLGYNTAEASTTMAKLSSKFASISPGMTTDEAQTGLVSIMKAFDIAPEDVETQIMDKINTLGNKFAENNLDVVTGMQTASAAMAAMGESFEDTAALFTAGMEILQDASQMGSALRSVALRVRGYDEETNELSEDLTEIKGKVIDLTKTASNPEGISLFTDTSQKHYKSMVQYLGEISEIWDEIDEKNQTALLQNLFAKTRANAGAAIIKNFDAVKASLEAMEQSAGSSEREMGIVTESLTYKLNDLAQTWVGFAQSSMNRDGLGFVIDSLTNISELITGIIGKIGIVPTIGMGGAGTMLFKNLTNIRMFVSSFKEEMAGISKVSGEVNALKNVGASVQDFAEAISGLNLKEAQYVLTQNQVDEEVMRSILLDAGLVSEKDKVTLSLAKQMVASKGLAEATREEILATIESAYANGQWNVEELKKIALTDTESASVARKILAMNGEITVTKGLTTALKEKVAMELASIAADPTKMILAATVALVALVVAVDKFHKNLKESIEDLKEANSSVADSKSELDEMNKEFELTGERLKELQSLSDNTTISVTDQEELDNLKEQNEELERNIALQEEKLRQEVKDDLKALNKAEKKTVLSKYSYTEDEDGLMTFNSVLPEDELQMAIAYYKDQEEAYNRLDKNADDYEKKSRMYQNNMSAARDRALEMQDAVSELTTGLQNASTLLPDMITDDQASRLDKLNSSMASYFEFLSKFQEKSYSDMDESEKIAARIEHIREAFENKGIKDVDLTVFSLEELETLDSNIDEAAKKLSDIELTKPIYDSFKKTQDEIAEYGVDLNKTVYGNIDTNARQVLKWTDGNLNKFRSELNSWGVESIEEMKGSISTVFGGSENFDGVEIAFSPILQTENGPILLSSDTVYKYIREVIANCRDANGDWTSDDVLGFDRQGLTIDGIEIKNILADIGDTAIQTGYAMHYVGELGDYNLKLKECSEAAKKLSMSTAEWLETMSNSTSARSALSFLFGALGQVEEKVFDISGEEISQKIDDYQSAIASLQSNLQSMSNMDLSDDLDTSAIIDLMQSYHSFDWNSYGVTGEKGVGKIADALKDLMVLQKETISETLRNAGASEQLIGAFGAMTDQAIRTATAFHADYTELSNLASNYSTVQNILSEYVETGSLSLDNTVTMLQMSDAYLAALMDENGQLVLNDETYRRLVDARLDEAEAQATQQALQDIASIDSESAAIEYLTNNHYVLANSLYEVANGYSSVQAAASAALSAQGVTVNQKQAIEGIRDAYNARMAVINAARESIANSVPLTLNPSGVQSANNTSKGNDSGSDGSSSKANEDNYEELVDFFERRIKVLNNANELLEKNIENVVGAYAKNNLINSQIGIAQEEIRNYSDAVSMYTQKANEALAKLPSDIAARVQNGSVSMIDFIGEGNEDVVDAIKDYENWADKIDDCKQNLAELKATIRKLELDKFNNIVADYTNQFDIYNDSIDLIDKQVSLLEESGELVGEAFYSTKMQDTQKQLSILERERVDMVNAMNSALSSGNIQAGTDEWLEMVNALTDVDGSILDCKKSIEEFDNAILEIHTKVFDRIQEQFSHLDSEMDNLVNLFDNSAGVTDGNRNWTREALAQLGLLAERYELAQYQVSQYSKEIDKLNDDYLSGRYSVTEYTDKLAELSEAQWDAVNSAESVKDAIIDLNETRVDEIIDGINKEIEAYKDLTDAQIEALQAEKDLHDYEESIAEKSKSVADLEKQLAAMQNDDTAATIAKRLQLEEELASARKDLEETEYEHSIQAQEDALNKQYEAYEEERNLEIETLENSLKNTEMIMQTSLNAVKQNAQTIGQEIVQIATTHGVAVSNEIISAWMQGENAIASYGVVLSEGTSAFIGNIMQIEAENWNLQAQANQTADTLAYMFATKADGLVNELVSSYQSEWNLNAMTQALHDSLIQTLQGGYDISSLVNSLSSVSDEANKAANAVLGIGNAMNAALGAKSNISSTVQAAREMDPHYLHNNSSTPYTVPTGSGSTTRQQLWDKTGAMYHYASGTRNAESVLRVQDEDGNELVLPKLSSGRYAIGNIGDQILTKGQTDNIFDWSKTNPADFVKFKNPINVSDMIKTVGTSRPIASFAYDSLIHVDGDVNNSNITQIEKAVQKGISDLADKVNRDFRYLRK